MFFYFCLFYCSNYGVGHELQKRRGANRGAHTRRRGARRGGTRNRYYLTSSHFLYLFYSTLLIGPMETSERTSIFFIVTFLIVVSILFEFLKHLIEHSADESMKPIVEGLFRGIYTLHPLYLFLPSHTFLLPPRSLSLFYSPSIPAPFLNVCCRAHCVGICGLGDVLSHARGWHQTSF